MVGTCDAGPLKFLWSFSLKAGLSLVIGSFFSVQLFAQQSTNEVSFSAREENVWSETKLEGQESTRDTDFRISGGGKALHKTEWSTALLSEGVSIEHNRSLKKDGHATDVGATIFGQKDFSLQSHMLTLYANYGRYSGQTSQPFTLWLSSKSEETTYRRVGVILLDTFTLSKAIQFYLRTSAARFSSAQVSILYGIAAGFIIGHTERLTSTIEGMAERQIVVDSNEKTDITGGAYTLAYDATPNTKISGKVGRNFLFRKATHDTVDLFGAYLVHKDKVDEDSLAVEKTLGTKETTDVLIESNSIQAAKKREIDDQRQLEIRCGYRQEKTVFSESNRTEHLMLGYVAYRHFFGTRVKSVAKGYSTSITGDYRFESGFVEKSSSQRHTLGIGINHALL